MHHGTKPLNPYHAPGHSEWFRHRQAAWTGPTKVDLKALIENAKTKVLLTIAKIWQQPKRPSTDAWLKKMWYIYTMEYYSAIKKNEILPFAATWMDLETIILSEISQTEKDKYWVGQKFRSVFSIRWL